MSSILSSQCLVLATAMAVSSTLVFLSFSRQKTFSPTQISEKSQKKVPLRSCLYSGDKKRGSKKKKVHFSEEIEEESTGESEVVVGKQSKVEISCRNEARCRIPANRVALYNGMLKDRVHRIECSY